MQRQEIVSQQDWTLHRKGYEDQKRHNEKVQEAIRKKLPEIISDESIVTSDGKHKVKIPIRSLNEYKIRYNNEKQKHIGSGDGSSDIGDIVAQDGSGQDDEQGKGKGGTAGDEAGIDYYEIDVEISEIETSLFSELTLPNLEEKDIAKMTVEDFIFNDIRKQGLMGNIDKKRTILEALKRNARHGSGTIAPISNEDLRFKTWNDIEKPQSNAVVLAMMDTSGSMGRYEKTISRSFFFWMTKFLRHKYEHVEICYIAHHTQAKLVSEEEFFTKGESGGTICSSAYEMALHLIDTIYKPNEYNIYPFHFSDGDNLSTDNRKCLGLVEQLMNVSNMFGYGEVNAYRKYSTLMNTYRHIEDKKFRHYILRNKEDIYHALKRFFKN
ncbi:MAG TPA: sporulation protein YhbH [Pseudogracilibacillus sp.]|nr:sporulation protein YhbH [Pseudogracilibacillus sp.]